ncbi:MAG TPA: YebC/PmpR family DNA-binding transcriptional regulator [Candidatus Paceibacterota bacterium]|nr:YebC/PmpR family DNA-binding transcriptional regulator [Candidatus Paceibacterota bacterium]
MSGHSKWAQIRHKKGINDQKRGQLFSKLSKAITLAARNGSDPKSNLALANAIDQARAMNMPNDNIERAIKKVSDKESARLQEVIIEAIGPGGVALRAKGVTDNTNRTINEVKKILGEHNAKMVPPGSIAWMFNTPASIDETAQGQLEILMEALDNQDDIDDVVTNLQ